VKLRKFADYVPIVNDRKIRLCNPIEGMIVFVSSEKCNPHLGDATAICSTAGSIACSLIIAVLIHALACCRPRPGVSQGR
jgi:hypothetical protein